MVQESEMLVVGIGQESKQLVVGQENGQEQLQEGKYVVQEEEVEEKEQNSNVAIGEKVGTIDKMEGRFLEKVNNVYHDGFGGHQNEESAAENHNTEDNQVEAYSIRNEEQIPESCSSGKDKEEKNIQETEISRGGEFINDHKAEKDEKLIEKDTTCRPDHLVEGIESKHGNDEEDEDIMREIEEQLKDVSVARM